MKPSSHFCDQVKRRGFSDRQIAYATKSNEMAVRSFRQVGETFL